MRNPPHNTQPLSEWACNTVGPAMSCTMTAGRGRPVVVPSNFRGTGKADSILACARTEVYPSQAVPSPLGRPNSQLCDSPYTARSYSKNTALVCHIYHPDVGKVTSIRGDDEALNLPSSDCILKLFPRNHLDSRRSVLTAERLYIRGSASYKPNMVLL